MRAYRLTALTCTLGFVAAVAVLAFPSPSPAVDPAAGEAAPAKKAEPAKEAAEPVEPADNSFCLVCHLNYEEEELTRTHCEVGIGCEQCHGVSKKHSGDEDGLTPPDIMYASEDVNKFCVTCHPKEKLLDYDRTEKVEYHREVFDPKAEEQLICTECHGEKHRMAVRTRRWDKTTRKLISDDGVRMMYENSPATEGVQSTNKKP